MFRQRTSLDEQTKNMYRYEPPATDSVILSVAKRRARLARRSQVFLYDFPPAIPQDTAERLLKLANTKCVNAAMRSTVGHIEQLKSHSNCEAGAISGAAITYRPSFVGVLELSPSIIVASAETPFMLSVEEIL
eukprot:Tbor_TRINITY_DN5255_c3_g2::TRINITY_DN5255_c3_g2_i1::g.16606::m.16606